MGQSMGPLAYPTLDFSAERVLACYAQKRVQPDPASCSGARLRVRDWWFAYRAAAAFLRSLLSLPPAQVPELDEQAILAISLPSPRSVDAGPAEAVPERREPLPLPTSELLRFIGSTPEASRDWSAPSLAERQVAGGLVVAGCVTAVMTMAMSPLWLMGLGLAGGAGLAWARSAYLRQEPVKRRRACLAWLEKATRKLEQAEAQAAPPRTLVAAEDRAGGGTGAASDGGRRLGVEEGHPKCHPRPVPPTP